MRRKICVLMMLILAVLSIVSVHAETYEAPEDRDFVYVEAAELVQNTAAYTGQYVRTSFKLKYVPADSVFHGEYENGAARVFELDVKEGLSLETVEPDSVIAVEAYVGNIPATEEENIILTILNILAPVDTDGVPSGRVNYICNTNTDKFHIPDCSSVDQMKEKNKAFFTGTRDEAIEEGYDPCKRCEP